MRYLKDKILGLLILSSGLLAAANQNSKKDEIQGRIYGGGDARPGDFPFYCSLAIKDLKSTDEVKMCSCVILGRKWVASVTSCTKDYPAEQIYVYAGYPTTTITYYEQNIRSRAKFEHPDYEPNLNDIVLVELKKELVYSEHVLPIQLPLNDKDVVPVKTECKIMGFGETEDDPISTVHRPLQEGTVYVVPKVDCLFTYGNIIKDSHVCANHPTQITGICKGDAGSPLACFDESKNDWVLRGVASFGTSVCGIASAAEVFTRISHYVKWIREIVIECDLPPELPPNVFTNATHHHLGTFKVGEKIHLFCEEGHELKKGAIDSTCRMSGAFDEIDTQCMKKSVYSDWKIGGCSVTCGEGTRMDTRECLEGSCPKHLHVVSPCWLKPCPDGTNVCRDLRCSFLAACEKLFDEENLNCHCLPGYTGDGKTCERNVPVGEEEEEKEVPVYTGWTLGRCIGRCGTGKRTDTRECARGNCVESTIRQVDCILPNPCPENNHDECKKHSLDCHKEAKCVKLEKELSFVCECIDGFFGNGKICGLNGGWKLGVNKFAFVLVAAYFLF